MVDTRPSNRRTNTVQLKDDGLVTKIYKNNPVSVLCQVPLGIRSPHALRGVYRWETERRKIRKIEAIGLPMPFEQYDFVNNGVPSLTTNYIEGFETAEDRVRNSVTLDEALTTVTKCAQALRQLHYGGKTARLGFTLTHGDPFLENFGFVPAPTGERVVAFDFEHEHKGDIDITRDVAFLYWHAFDVLVQQGYGVQSIDPFWVDWEPQPIRGINSLRDVGLLMDAVQEGYPEMERSWLQVNGRAGLYFHFRFGQDREYYLDD